MGTGWTGTGVGLGTSQRIEEAVERMEMELRSAIAYVNGNVVPQVRRESITAMRTIAGTLRDMADRMEKAAAKGSQR
jgi:sulfur carrier protein ThiS